MRKAILYFIFLGLLFSNSRAHAVASYPDVKIKEAVHKNHNENTANRGVSKRGSFSHKADLLIDFDYIEEYDTENNSGSLKGKHSCFIITFLLDNKRVCLIEKPFCTNTYTRQNFSRLPRFTHISLRVLLI